MITFSGPISPEGQARLDRHGSTLTDDNVRHVVERIGDYPEIIAAVRALAAPSESSIPSGGESSS